MGIAGTDASYTRRGPSPPVDLVLRTGELVAVTTGTTAGTATGTGTTGTCSAAASLAALRSAAFFA